MTTQHVAQRRTTARARRCFKVATQLGGRPGRVADCTTARHPREGRRRWGAAPAVARSPVGRFHVMRSRCRPSRTATAQAICATCRPTRCGKQRGRRQPLRSDGGSLHPPMVHAHTTAQQLHVTCPSLLTHRRGPVRDNAVCRCSPRRRHTGPLHRTGRLHRPVAEVTAAHE